MTKVRKFVAASFFFLGGTLGAHTHTKTQCPRSNITNDVTTIGATLFSEASKRAVNVREKGTVFSAWGFQATGLLFTQLAHAIEAEDKQRCEDIWYRILPSLRDEYAQQDQVFLRLYDFVENIVFNSLEALKEKGFREKLLELAPSLAALGRAADVIGELSRAFLKGGLDNKLKYYAACVLYAIDVEGQFGHACRVLYLLYKSSIGEVIPLSEIEKLSLRKIREELKTLTHGESEILFLGWEDNHLRNAIFHMRIEYDNSSNEMSFEDYDMAKGKSTYDEKLTYAEFSRRTHLINGVSFVFLFIMMILSARDMAFAKELL